MAPPLNSPSFLSTVVNGGCILTIGNFDGLHRGHQRLVDAACEEAHTQGLPAVALTFEPHPRTFFGGTPPHTFRLTTAEERSALLKEAGIAEVWACPFNSELASMTPLTFLETLLMGALGARSIHVGSAFVFGKGRSGDVDWLVKEGALRGITVTGHPEVTEQERAISSSRVRRALETGDLAGVELLAGRPWHYRGQTQPGAGRGKGMGIPTLNLHPGPVLLPPYGVYATSCSINGGGWRPSITNIGVRPTFEEHATPTIETLILDGRDVPEGSAHPLTVRLHRFLRPEMTFPNPKALSNQIRIDVLEAQNVHASISSLHEA